MNNKVYHIDELPYVPLDQLPEDLVYYKKVNDGSTTFLHRTTLGDIKQHFKRKALDLLVKKYPGEGKNEDIEENSDYNTVLEFINELYE